MQYLRSLNKAFFLDPDQRGFSIIEVLVAISLASGLALYLASLGNQQTKLAKTADFRAQTNEIFFEISTLLKKNENACMNTLENIWPGDSITELKTSDDPVNGIIAKAGFEFRRTGVRVIDMTLIKPDASQLGGMNNAGYIDPKTGKGTFLLRIRLQNMSATRVFGSDTITKDIPIMATYKNSMPNNATFMNTILETDLINHCEGAIVPLNSFNPGSVSIAKNPDGSLDLGLYSPGAQLIMATFECLWVATNILNNPLYACEVN